jgi:hypothetical protein
MGKSTPKELTTNSAPANDYATWGSFLSLLSKSRPVNLQPPLCTSLPKVPYLPVDGDLPGA